MGTSFEGARVMVQSIEPLDVARKYFEVLFATVAAELADDTVWRQPVL
jgi:hypothetical protein